MTYFESKGNYKNIDNYKNKEIKNIISQLDNYSQNQDLDTFINEYKDSKCAYILGFNYVNKKKHGFDAKDDNNNFLEVKQSRFYNNSLKCTFNDTTIEKANSFTMDNVYLALSVCKNLSDISFIVYGKNKNLGKFLLERVKEQNNKGIRRSQSVSLTRLIKKYSFNIKPVTMNKDEIIYHFTSKYFFKEEEIIKLINT